MKYLLDTHTFLWAIGETEKLSKKVLEIIENTDNEIFTSVVNTWEICIKYSIGKLDLKKDPEKFILDEIREANFQILDIKLSHLFPLTRLPNFHKDPFDRILIAQSQTENIPILSNDPLIKKYKVKAIW